MKINRAQIFIALSSLALVLVLFIQVNWIMNTAKIKEELFNEKANMVLSKTTDALLLDTAACERIDDSLNQNDKLLIDNLFKKYMDFYDFHIDYTFKVKKHAGQEVFNDFRDNYKTPNQPACIQNNLVDAASKSGIELKLVFPSKNDFIFSEMEPMFISSIILILIVLFLFWRTVVSLLKEKEISEHTTDFLNNMTHEFKTPLTNIALAGKMLSKDSIRNDEEKIKHYTGIVLEENEKLVFQVEQMLSMVELEKGEVPLNKTTLNLNDLISDVIKNINIQVENKSGKVTLNLNTNNAVIHGDKIHLTLVFSNLMDNALKYSVDFPNIVVTTLNRENNLIITILDHGIGISEEHQKKIFDKYFRVTKGNIHNVKGFGLGLPYVKKIIELHLGTIEVKSELNNGTTFTITLPNV